MRWERADLAALVGQVLEDLAGPIEDRGARVELSALPAVRGDRQRLRQLLQNLIANAVKFSRDEPLVEVGAEADGDGGCCVTVRDHGMGFDPEKCDEIFRPFSRLQEASGTEGSGIGLAICERIVLRHGGAGWGERTTGAGGSGSRARGARAALSTSRCPWPTRAPGPSRPGTPSRLRRAPSAYCTLVVTGASPALSSRTASAAFWSVTPSGCPATIGPSPDGSAIPFSRNR